MAYTGINEVKAVLTRRGEELRWSDTDIENAIDLAERIINAYCGRHFYDEATTEIHMPYNGLVILDCWPIMRMISVKDAETGDDIDYTIRSAELGHMWVSSDSFVKITYTYNDPSNPVPADVARVAAETAANILTLAHEAYTDLRLGDIDMAGPEGGRYLTSSLRAILTRYRCVGIPR